MPLPSLADLLILSSHAPASRRDTGGVILRLILVAPVAQHDRPDRNRQVVRVKLNVVVGQRSGAELRRDLMDDDDSAHTDAGKAARCSLIQPI